jgi:hypothetical protein
MQVTCAGFIVQVSRCGFYTTKVAAVAHVRTWAIMPTRAHMDDHAHTRSHGRPYPHVLTCAIIPTRAHMDDHAHTRSHGRPYPHRLTCAIIPTRAHMGDHAHTCSHERSCPHVHTWTTMLTRAHASHTHDTTNFTSDPHVPKKGDQTMRGTPTKTGERLQKRMPITH